MIQINTSKSSHPKIQKFPLKSSVCGSLRHICVSLAATITSDFVHQNRNSYPLLQVLLILLRRSSGFSCRRFSRRFSSLGFWHQGSHLQLHVGREVAQVLLLTWKPPTCRQTQSLRLHVGVAWQPTPSHWSHALVSLPSHPRMFHIVSHQIVGSFCFSVRNFFSSFGSKHCVQVI